MSILGIEYSGELRRVAGMRNEARRDLLKVWLYAVATVVLGAALTPWAYNVGKALAEVTIDKQTNGLVEVVAHWCRQAGVPWFFKRSWAFVAVVLFVPLVGWLTVGGGGVRRKVPWWVRLPGGGRNVDGGQELDLRKSAPWDALKGVLVTVTLVIVLAAALVQAGAFGWRGPDLAAMGGLLRLVSWALGLAVLQEVVFRGFALGIFLRATGAAPAILLAGLLYALVGVLIPPDGLTVVDPEGSRAGFELLSFQLKRLADPWIVASVLLPWWAFGTVLGFARWRTRSLWLPIGLHTGWVLGNSLFLTMAVPLNQPDPIARVLVGGSLQDGLIPLVAMMLAGIVLHFMTPAPELDHGAD